jgi:hypothetical protein
MPQLAFKVEGKLSNLYCLCWKVVEIVSKFLSLSFQEWLKSEVRLLHGGARFVKGDLRKFCEQMGDILQWDQSNKNYILTHRVVGADR